MFCLVDEELKKNWGTEKLRKGDFNSTLSDSEINYIEIIAAEFLAIDTDKGI